MASYWFLRSRLHEEIILNIIEFFWFVKVVPSPNGPIRNLEFQPFGNKRLFFWNLLWFSVSSNVVKCELLVREQLFNWSYESRGKPLALNLNA